MPKSILAVLVVACGAFVFASTQASAGGRYRPNDPVITFCWPNPGYDYDSAYLYNYRKAQRRHFHGQARACGRCGCRT